MNRTDMSSKPVVVMKGESKGDGKGESEGGGGVEEFKEPGDVNDVKQTIPSLDQLNDMKELLQNASPDQLNKLLLDVSKQNKINPNESYYSSVNKEDITKMRLKKKLKDMQKSRKSPIATKFADAKLAAKMAEKMKQFENEKKKDGEKTVSVPTSYAAAVMAGGGVQSSQPSVPQPSVPSATAPSAP